MCVCACVCVRALFIYSRESLSSYYSFYVSGGGGGVGGGGIQPHGPGGPAAHGPGAITSPPGAVRASKRYLVEREAVVVSFRCTVLPCRCLQAGVFYVVF